MPERLYERDSVLSEEVLASSYGKRLSRVKLRHPITKEVETWIFYDQQNWSVTMAVTDDGMVVTTWQYYQGVDETLQVLTGGNDDIGGESAKEVARRELREESGYDAQEVIALGTLPLSVRNSQTCCSLFLALGCKKWQDGSFDEKEVIRVELVPLEDWIRMVFTTIEEGCSREATFLALPHLVRQFPSLDINKILREI